MRNAEKSMGELVEGAGAPSSRQPDREDVLLGLSPSGFHELAFVDWGRLEDKRPIICIHGLTRQGRDFDYLAKRLVDQGRRVICPDLPGRGRNSRLADPDDYALPQYCADMNALIARLGVAEVDLVGTSLGGLIGIIVAGFSGSIVRSSTISAPSCRQRGCIGSGNTSELCRRHFRRSSRPRNI